MRLDYLELSQYQWVHWSFGLRIILQTPKCQMDPARLRLDNLAHAHWRVKFLKRLLDVHRHCSNRTNTDWLLEEASLLQRIAAADDELTLRKRDFSGWHGNQRATG